jgi:methylated-DNA-[protein]-cysteine S-methyltransferase
LGSYPGAAEALTSGFQARIAAPFAVIGVRTSGRLLTEIVYLPREAATLAPQDDFAAEVCRQLGAYLRDPEFAFDLPFEYRGTTFQNRVWRIVREIPAGATLSYREVAARARSAPRPVGMACGANRLPLVIPCHRVLAANGIGGFMHSRKGPGIDIKRWLLAHEGVRA